MADRATLQEKGGTANPLFLRRMYPVPSPRNPNATRNKGRKFLWRSIACTKKIADTDMVMSGSQGHGSRFHIYAIVEVITVAASMEADLLQVSTSGQNMASKSKEAATTL